MFRNLIVLPGGRDIFSGQPGVAIMECTLTRTVNSGEELTPGSVCSAMLEFDLIHPAEEKLTAGQEVTLFHVAEDGSRRQVGVFCLEKPVRTGTHRCRVTAYDRVSKLDKDLTDWLSSRVSDCTLAEFARQVSAQCGVTLAGDIPNGSLTVNPFTAASVTGRQLMKWIGEAAGCFCRATPTGTLELAWYTPSDITLAPGVTEPAIITENGGNVAVSSRSVKTLDDNRGDVTLTAPVLSMTSVGEKHAALEAVEQSAQIPWFLGELELGEYQVTPVEAVQLRLPGGVLWPEAKEGANAYFISGNPILNRTTEDVRDALGVILHRLASVGGYTPCKVSIPATGEILPGSILTLTDTWGNTHSLPVMSVTRAGQKDTLECTGEHRRDSASAKNNKSPDQIAQEKVDALSQADIFNKLTDNGKLQGLYIQDGKLYINGEYVKVENLDAKSIVSGELYGLLLKAGAIESLDGNIKLDLTNSQKAVFDSGIVANDIILRHKDNPKKTLLSITSGLTEKDDIPYCLLNMSDVNGNSVFGVYPSFQVNSDGTSEYSGTTMEVSAKKSNAGLSAAADNAALTLSRNNGMFFSVFVSDGSVIFSLPDGAKRVSWKDNGDGTYTLIGT